MKTHYFEEKIVFFPPLRGELISFQMCLIECVLNWGDTLPVAGSEGSFPAESCAGAPERTKYGFTIAKKCQEHAYI